MKDILPEQTSLWQEVEDTARSVFDSYGYSEIRVPVVERTELFRRSIGEATDVVEKEMYTFEDRDGDSLSLRPEATAGVVRAGLTNGFIYNQRQRLWYSGPMFRYEKPQRGRYRQFYQIGAEAFGYPAPQIDAELLFVCARLWDRVGLELRLEINSLGTLQARAEYRAKLVEYLAQHRNELDDDSRRRLKSNPLRILDSKNPEMAELIANAPLITDHLDPVSRSDFNQLKTMLDDAGARYVVNPHLVRGLDYYTGLVFEWLTDDLGAQGAVCAGGRYDNLVAELGGQPTVATGFSIGLDRLVELLAQQGAQGRDLSPEVYLVAVGDEAPRVSMRLAEELRERLTGLRLENDCTGGGFRAQMKRADRSGARLAVLLGDDEFAGQYATVKNLRDDTEQERVSWTELCAYVDRALNGAPA